MTFPEFQISFEIAKAVKIAEKGSFCSFFAEKEKNIILGKQETSRRYTLSLGEMIWLASKHWTMA